MSSKSGEWDILSREEYDEYSVSYYDYFTTGECIGFGWDLSNFTQDQDFESIVNSKVTLVLTLFIQPLIAVFGILGNLAFMFIVCKEPQMRNNMNLILLNLAVADLLYLLVGTGEKFVNVLKSPVFADKNLFGRVVQCFIITPLLNIVSFTSLLLVSYLSVERCIAICKPMTHLRMNSRKRTFYFIGLIWFSSSVLTVIILPSYAQFFTVCIKWPNDALYSSYPTQAGFCEPQGGFWISIGEVVEIFPFFIALILNVVCFSKIISKLYKRISPSSAGEQLHEEDYVTAKQRNSAHAATRMLLINGIAFFILATPFHVTNAIQFAESIFHQWNFHFLLFKDFSLLLLYVNSAVNPYIYGVTNQSYRKAYQKLFCKRWSNDSTHKSLRNTDETDALKGSCKSSNVHSETII